MRMSRTSRVLDALRAVLLGQTLRHAENTAVGADVFTEQDDPLVRPQSKIEGPIGRGDGLAVLAATARILPWFASDRAVGVR